MIKEDYDTLAIFFEGVCFSCCSKKSYEEIIKEHIKCGGKETIKTQGDFGYLYKGNFYSLPEKEQEKIKKEV